MGAFTQPIPTYAEVSYSVTDKKTGKTTNTFNPVWLGWFLALGEHVNSAADLGSAITGVLPTVNGGTATDISTYYSGTVTLAALSGGGTQGSLTVVNGLIQSAVPPT